MATLFVCDRCDETAARRGTWSSLKSVGARPGAWDLCQGCMAVVLAVLDQCKDTPEKESDASVLHHRVVLSDEEVQTLEHIWAAATATDQDSVQ